MLFTKDKSRGADAHPGQDRPLAIREGRVMFTPDMSARTLAECAFAGQRPIKDGHVATLRIAMTKGNFTAGTQLHFARVGGRLYLVNGHHRLHAHSLTDAPLEFQCLVTDCEDESEVAQLYYRHDTVSAVRGLADVVRATGTASAAGISESDARRTLAAVKVIVGRFSRAMSHQQEVKNLREPDEILAAAAPWWPYAKTYFAITEGASREAAVCLGRQHIVAVGLVTLKYQPDKAREFWAGMAADDGLRKGDPRKSALRFLLTHRIGSGGNPLAWGGIAGVSLCWNAWFRGEALNQVKASLVSEIVLLGTPVGRRVKK